MKEIFTTFFLPSLWAGIASMGFAVIFNIRLSGLPVCGVGAACGWLAYAVAFRMTGADVLSAFLAAMVVGAYSEGVARWRCRPVTGYLQAALLPLVPGSGVYHAMLYCVRGELDLFFATLLHTLGFAAALSVGAMLVTSLLRALLPKFRRSLPS